MLLQNKNLKLAPYQENDRQALEKLSLEAWEASLLKEVISNPLQKNCDLGKMFCGETRIWLAEDNQGQICGIAVLHKINSWHQTAELLFACSDEESEKGIKIFKEAVKLLLDFAFQTLELVRVQVEILEKKLGRRAIYKDLGFQEEGLLRSKYKINEKRSDVFVMSLLKVEWERLAR